MFKATRLYPKAHANRLHGSHPILKAPRRTLLVAAGKNFVILQVLFLALFAYIFGALYEQSGHTHNLNVLYVDYDGGIIGASVREAYDGLKANSFPTLDERTPAQFPAPKDLKEEVCSTRFWAALYTTSGASSRLEDALSSAEAAATYNRSDVLTFFWNEVLYSATSDSVIEGNLQTLSGAARLAYVASNGTAAIASLPSNASASINVFADPWTLTSLNMQATTQGGRLIYNTLVFILILIQEFFYLGTINGLYAQLKIYNRIYPHRIIAYRNGISGAYCLVGSLCVTGMIWAFRANWDVNADQFVLTWMALWLFAHANFLTLDVFTIWLPLPYVPMALITWVILNVTSILIPFALSPGFYKWAYAMPAHEVYLVLTDVWSRGCNPKLHYALPILFALELLGLFFSALGVYRRCHYAVLAEEAQEAAFRERVDAALVFERKRDTERDAEKSKEREVGGHRAESVEGSAEGRDREGLEEIISGQDAELERQRTRASHKSVHYGPSFALAFKDGEDSV